MRRFRALNRAEVFNPSLPRAIDLAGEPVLGGEVLENPLTEGRAKLNSKSPAAVSHVVLFEDKKPVCVADAVGRPELVPPFMKVTREAGWWPLCLL